VATLLTPSLEDTAQRPFRRFNQPNLPNFAQLSHCDWVCPKVPKFGFVQQANERTIPICKCAKI